MRTAVVFLAILILTASVALATGHGAPSGPHYNLNIIGVPRDKTADMTDNSGHRIFVKLDGKSKILLQEGDTFQVLDANGTKGSAKFQLPDPDPFDELALNYSVYARALGAPHGWAQVTTCYEDELGEQYCSGESVVFTRDKGKSKFIDVSKELLTLYVDTDGDGQADTRIGIFDEEFWEYFWTYDNHGCKLVQLRFYPISHDGL
jgi:hypothetical protein